MNPAVDARAARRRRAEAQQQVTRDREAAGRNTPWRRRYRKIRRRIGGWLTPLLLPTLLRALGATWRVERTGAERLDAVQDGGGFLVAIWHGWMLPPLPSHRHLGFAVLVSPSRDGEIVKMVLQRFGLTVIRGSTSKGSARALREMRGHLETGGSVVITPDGPRGPREQMNLGLAWLARETGCPILPVQIRCERAWFLSSWDRFCIPKPFARVRIHYDEPVRVATDADAAELEAATEAVRDRLQPRTDG